MTFINLLHIICKSISYYLIERIKSFMQTQQKIVVTYRRDQSFHQIDHLNQTNGLSVSREAFVGLENAILGKRSARNKKWKTLKEIISKNKVNRLTHNFIRKLRFNSIYRPPLEDLEDQKSATESSNGKFAKLKQQIQQIGQNEGIALNNCCLIFWNILNIIQTSFMVFIFSIMTAFSQTTQYPIFFLAQAISCSLYLLDIILNFILQRYESGKKLSKINQISEHYVNNGFTIDFLSLLMFCISLSISHSTVANILVTFIYFIKLLSCIRKLEKYQYLLITSNQKEQYYGLIKVFVTNFVIGHFLSVFLNLMPNFNQESNWHAKLGIMDSIWYIKYIWGYYWGTNIMLTVGFGDITATNHYQAIILVFIQTFSCITLAYNISNVGALIGSIRENQQSKKRKLKTFHRMCKQNEVCNEIESKISNFIEQSYQIKETFEHDARDDVIQFLPKQMQRQYRKEANKILFDGLGFLNNLSKKSLLTLAEEVNRKICHPEEIIVKKGSITDFCILQKGCLAFTCKTKSSLDGKIIQTFEVEGQAKPKILSLNFIKNKTTTYNIKSLNYSVLYYLNRESFMQSLSNSEMDYQLFCLLKDKDEYILNQNNLYSCPNCKNQYHDKFQCSRLHYIPLKQTVIMRHLTKSNKNMQTRTYLHRRKNIMQNFLHFTKELKEQQYKYIEDNFDNDHNREIQELLQFYSKKPAQNQTEMLTTTEDANNNNNNLANLECPKKRRSVFNTLNGHKSILDDKTISKLERLFEASKLTGNFWEFQIDVACDFGFYFKEGNPENLNRLKKYKKFKTQPSDFRNGNITLKPFSFFS